MWVHRCYGGMRVARQASELREEILSAKREAMDSFVDDTVLLEQLFDNVKHVGCCLDFALAVSFDINFLA